MADLKVTEARGMGSDRILEDSADEFAPCTGFGISEVALRDVFITLVELRSDRGLEGYCSSVLRGLTVASRSRHIRALHVSAPVACRCPQGATLLLKTSQSSESAVSSRRAPAFVDQHA